MKWLTVSLIAFTLTLVTLWPTSVHAQVLLTAAVDRSTIGEDESLHLSVRINEQIGRGGPDFELLKKDWDILNEQRNNQFRSINGRSEGWTEWSMVLVPKRSGTLLIPSFSFKGAYSNAIEVTVEKLGTTSANEQRDIFAVVEPSKSSVYVQEQLLITVKLHTAVDLREISVEDDLEIKDAIVENVSETTYRKQLGQRAYKVVELVYAVYPQQSGPLTIPALSWNAVVVNRQWQNDPFMTPRGTLKRIRSNEFTVEVESKPASYSGDTWLPAQDVALTQHWSTDPSRFVVGEPITRTITLSAKGLAAAQLPPLPNPQIKGLTFYSDQPQYDQRKSSEGIEGYRIESQAIVPTESGNLTLPAVTLSWWDTTQNKQRTATLPSQAVSIAPASITSNLQQNAASSSAPTSLQNSETAINPITNTGLFGGTAMPLWLLISNTITALLALLFLLAWLSIRRKLNLLDDGAHLDHAQQVSQQQARHTTQAFNDIRKACSDNKPQAARNALGYWGQAYWQLPHLASLEEIAKRCQSPALTKELEGLDKILYGNRSTADWNGNRLWKELVSFKQSDQRRKTTDKDSALPPLYPA